LLSTPASAPPATSATPRHVDGYEHLAPLFRELAALPPDDPRRAELRTRLVTGYLPVAQHIARKHGHRGEALEDLEQVATLGLIQAVTRFDPDRGPDFLSFAIPTINGEILRHFRDRAWVIRVPRRLRNLQSSIYQAVAELSQRLGRAPRPSEIAARLGIGVDEVVDGLQAHHAGHCFSLDEPAGDDASSTSRSRFEAVLARDEPELNMIEFRESLEPLIAELPAREQTILMLRFFGGLSQTEIARHVGISQMHVSRLLAATLARLRRGLTGEPSPRSGRAPEVPALHAGSPRRA
jgi:RNA polymerase sigma-B factor